MKTEDGFLDADITLGFVKTNCLFRRGYRTYDDIYEMSEEVLEEYHWNFPPTEKEDLAELLEDAINNAKLTEMQRTAIILRIYQDLTFEEVGQQMGVTRQGAYAHWMRGINNLRKYLEKKLFNDRQDDIY